jgi:AmmeMemoRadiSam system protein A
VSLKHDINKELTKRIYELAYVEGIPVVFATNSLLENYDVSVTLDHGALVPLYFIDKYYNSYKLVHITYAPLSDIELYKFGMLVVKAVEELGEKVVFIASGDLSHRLKSDGPYDYHPLGEKFDKEFIEHLQHGNALDLFSMDNETVCSAGECGRRSILIMLGALEGKKFKGDLMSYEGTFGVGYGVIGFSIEGDGDSVLGELVNLRELSRQKKHNQDDAYVRLARESLTHYLTTGEQMKELPTYVTDEMKNMRRGVFVSLKKHGELRGCIGTVFPTTNSAAEEIIRNAIEAGVHDPRFNEVEEEELLDIDFSVDVLTESEPANLEDLNPKEYGLIVRKGRRSGLLLPDLEGVTTVDEQLSIALRKAGINEDEDYTIEKFKVIRHKEA